MDTLFSVEIEYTDSGNDGSKKNNENSFGQEEIESEPFPHYVPFPVAFFSTSSVAGNSKKVNSFYTFSHSTESLDILSPPPQS